MYKSIILMYINNLNYEELSNYIDNNYENISENDKKIIFKYIKNRYQDIFDKKQAVFNDLKNELSSTTYNEVINLYNQYKDYLK